jgi:predicted AlkP superfamily pyrophosphatase or phosphodiesterase
LIPNFKNRVQVFEWMDFPGSTTVVNMRAYSSSDLSGLMNELSKSPFITCYLKENIPESYHLKVSPRVGDIWCVASIGAYMTTHGQSQSLGTHGYLNTEPTMNTIFIGNGPSFIPGMDVYPFSNIHLYTMFCHILDIPPKQNNGSLSAVSQFLH